jgi:hypothetical protein
MDGLFPEHSDILHGLLQGSGAGGVNGIPVYAGQCHDVTALFTIAVGGAANSDNQVTVAVRAAADNTGTGIVTLPFDVIFTKVGAPLLKDDPASGFAGDWNRVDYKPAVTSFQTLVADGQKQIQIAIPIRARQLPQGKPYLSAHVTALVAARVVGIQYIRSQNSYMAGINKDLY